eukprot:27621_1
MTSHRKVCVIGGGVNGLWTTLQLLETGFSDVTILSMKWSPHTTSDVAGGFILPYMALSSQSPADMASLARETFATLLELMHAYGARATGVQLVSGYEYPKGAREWPEGRPLEPEPWHDMMLGLRIVDSEELARLGRGENRCISQNYNCVDGAIVTVF